MQSAFQHVTPLLSKEPENEQAGHFSLISTAGGGSGKQDASSAEAC